MKIMKKLMQNSMTSCSDKKRRRSSMSRGWIVGGVLALVALFSCTERNSLFGNDLIPPSQLMKSYRDSTVRVETFITTVDSVDTYISGIYQAFFGSYIDELVGRTDISLFSHYVPYGFDHTHYFGINPVIDSLLLIVNVINVKGDEDQTNYIEAYEVVDYDFHRDSIYYSNFDMTPYIADQPLVTLERTGTGNYYSKLPMEFAERLLDNRQSKENIYYVDTAFMEKFKGMYFKFKEPATSGEGTMLTVDFSASEMRLYYTNEGPDDEAGKSQYQRLVFYDPLALYNINFSMIEHDYSYADPSKGGVVLSSIGDLDNPSEYCYVQGLAGLAGLLEINVADIRRLKEDVLQKGYRNMGIHKAELQVMVANPTADGMDGSFEGLGIYFDMTGQEFLPDYNPILDNITGSGYSSTLGGVLNRSRAMYTFDMSSYLQRLADEKEERFSVQLLPAYDSRNDFTRSWVYGSDSPYPPLLILTYTMLK